MSAKISDVNLGYNSCVMFLKHKPVFTQGTGVNLFALEENVINSDRGGQLTYHDPGQLICYLILKLSDYNLHPGQYVRFLHNWLSVSLAKLNLTLKKQNDPTGIWIQGNDGKILKVAFIGVKICDGVTKHGFSVNLCADLDVFKSFPVCNIGYTKTIGNLGFDHQIIMDTLLSNFPLRSNILYADSTQYFSKYFG